MLAPEVINFPPPKVFCSLKKNVNTESVEQTILMNNFYKSIIVTCPDEHNTDFLQDVIGADSDYYKLSNCPITEFVDRDFIEYFVKNGKLTCLSADTNCIVQNCAAVTPDGKLTIHVLEFVYQTLGLEGTKRPHGYYEICVDLKHLKHLDRIRKALAKLEISDFLIAWEPSDEKVCPSSIAKYFFDKKIPISVHSMTFDKVTPSITQIPTLVDTDVEEVVEWMGMLALGGDITPTEDYISSYSEPECDLPIQSTRIAILIAKGFLIPSTLLKLCTSITEYVESRELDNYWVAMSIQGQEECLWQFSPGTPKMFQSHNSSCSVFFTQNGCTVHSIGQLKYS